MNATEQRRKPSGGTTAKVPVTAADTLAEGEFNRFYVRGLGRKGLQQGDGEFVVYLAKEVAQPRPESEDLIGTTVDGEKLLSDLRTNIGVEPALGVPKAPDSGLSVQIVKTLTAKN